VTVCLVLVQQLLISKSTLSPGLITVNGVPVFALLNQLPGSSVRLIVSAVPPSANVVRGIPDVAANRTSDIPNAKKEKRLVFIRDDERDGIGDSRHKKLRSCYLQRLTDSRKPNRDGVPLSHRLGSRDYMARFAKGRQTAKCQPELVPCGATAPRESRTAP
jgi:hypothetical protein